MSSLQWSEEASLGFKLNTLDNFTTNFERFELVFIPFDSSHRDLSIG